uniref:Uncharacterized protein n=1 Tax=Vitis vinifera TaxID=29760 RepID=A5BKV0_VITVI|nr:hypothetical protein VITISV_007762 [Vitis vinifera]
MSLNKFVTNPRKSKRNKQSTFGIRRRDFKRGSEQPWWRVESLDNEVGSEVVVEGIGLVLHLLDDPVLALEDLNEQLLNRRHLPLVLLPLLLLHS